MGPITSALGKVSAAYVPGVAKFFAEMPSNPWWKEHEDFERAILANNQGVTEVSAQRFTRNCIGLIEVFKKTGIKAKGISSADALYMEEPKINAWRSRKEKKCMHCESKENLTIIELEKGSMIVGIICRRCRDERIKV